MKLHSVETCFFGKDEGCFELLLDCLDVFKSHFFRHWILSVSKCCDLLAILNSRRRPWFKSSSEGRMSDSARVEGLQEKNSSLLMDSLNNFLPALSLLLVIDAALPRETVSSLRDSCGLSEKQTSTSSLTVILREQIGGNSVEFASDSSQCTEEGSILEF